ncbi:MAG: penicillin-binding protein 2 [Corynebacterium sp.]|nr:penicillin-binding protein 2 [Corynebacterium sp.]
MRGRMRLLSLIAILLSVVLVARLAWVQIVWGPAKAEEAQSQREFVYIEPARRGEVTDRTGKTLAYTMQASSLTISPLYFNKELPDHEYQLLLEEDADKKYTEPQLRELANQRAEETKKRMAEQIPEMVRGKAIGADNIKPSQLLEKIQRTESGYEILVANVDPDVAAEVAATFWGVANDRQEIRQYPNGAIGENVIGKVKADGAGQFGLEEKWDATLGGRDGSYTVDTSRRGEVIPGTTRDRRAVIDGSDIQLTLDLDLQAYVQAQVQQAKDKSLAESASAVVLDAKTAKVLAMANSDTADPTKDLGEQVKKNRSVENSPITAPFEPGSVAKIITAAAAIEEGVTTPDEVHTVPGTISMAGVNVHDAWDHGDVRYTTTGIFGKSSNVGTLQLAQRLGEDTYARYLTLFGLGQATGVELPTESDGLVPDRSQWSGGTFANLPIGQGMSWTLLQMAGVYQTIANGGVRIQPRIVEQVTTPTGDPVADQVTAPESVQVISPETAATLLRMFQSVIQNDPTGVNSGTGPGAAISGYQVAGKTGTAQQVDPQTGAYSNSMYWITFAGIAPADDPRFVVAIMLDNPQRGVHGEGGQSAAPLFHDIASWLLDRDNVPLSPDPSQLQPLQVP